MARKRDALALHRRASSVMPAPALYIRDSVGLFDDAGVLRDQQTCQSLQAVLDAFARWTASHPAPGG